MGIANHIERELKRRDWSQGELSRQSGLKPQVISDLIKQDRNPQIDTIIKLANGFGISIDEFVVNPKPAPKIRGKPTGIKEVRQCLKAFGLDDRDIKLAMSLIVQMGEAQKAKGKAATG
jgi:transcriptional regulator with XRE-family HTH domain